MVKTWRTSRWAHFVVIQDYIQAPWTAFCRIKLCTKRRVVRPSFLTIQFAIEIGRRSKMSKDHTQVFPKSAAPGPKVATGGGGSWLVSPSCSPFLIVNCSYFALFFLITCDLGLFLDVSCSSWSILALWHRAAILGWLITAAQWKNQLLRHIHVPLK